MSAGKRLFVSHIFGATIIEKKNNKIAFHFKHDYLNYMQMPFIFFFCFSILTQTRLIKFIDKIIWCNAIDWLCVCFCFSSSIHLNKLFNRNALFRIRMNRKWNCHSFSFSSFCSFYSNWRSPVSIRRFVHF